MEIWIYNYVPHIERDNKNKLLINKLTGNIEHCLSNGTKGSSDFGLVMQYIEAAATPVRNQIVAWSDQHHQCSSVNTGMQKKKTFTIFIFILLLIVLEKLTCLRHFWGNFKEIQDRLMLDPIESENE